MHLTDDIKKRYTREQLSAREAQRLAEYIAWAPVIFQATRIMLKSGILDAVRDSKEGLTQAEMVEASGYSPYAVKCLAEASLSIGTLLVGPKTERYTLSKVGWFVINDPAARVNIDFNHDVNYLGWHKLEESLKSGKPEGLKVFGEWPTIYEGLSSLPEHVQKSWFGFDHFYSDSSFSEALEVVFGQYHPKTLYDVGGNTGRWAIQCVEHDPDVTVTILDLPQQIGLMEKQTASHPYAGRIHGYGINLLDPDQRFPVGSNPDAIWMSQFLDCFSMEQIVDILHRAAEVMGDNSRLFIMETLWDRQRFEPATLCLTMTSLYFTALANGNSKMYNTEDMEQCIHDAGLAIEQIHDGLGQGHSIIVCKKIN